MINSIAEQQIPSGWFFPTAGTNVAIQWGRIGPATTASPNAVPEPASWAMMIGGLGAIGVAMRRRCAIRTGVAFA